MGRKLTTILLRSGNIYHMGLAALQLPSYFIADQFASWLSYKRDGFSKPYHIAYLLNALIFIILGVVYLRKLLLIYFNELTVAFVVLVLYVCSNISPTFIDAYQLTHLYLFAINAMMLYFFLKFTSTEIKKHLIFSALLFGLSCFIRPTQAIWGIIPLILLWKKYGRTKKMLWLVAFFPIAAILMNVPHVIYWKTIGGKLFMTNLHTEEIVLIDPNFWNFLFSYRKGWLLYTPIFLLLIPGFIHLYRSHRNLFWAFASLVFINIWVLCSWECWWYAASYSSRVMVDSYPLLAIIFGFAFVAVKKNKLFIGIFSVFIMACCWLNFIQIEQYHKTYLHTSRMSKQQYWYIFGRTEIPNYSDYRLEIERTNLNWRENSNYKNDPNFEIKKKVVFEKKGILEFRQGIIIGEFGLKQLPSDETLFEVSFKCKSTDSLINAEFRMEQTGYFNTYSWSSIQVSHNLPQNTWNEFSYNMNQSYLRHSGDFMQLYTTLEGNGSIQISNLKVVAYSLVRK